MHTYKNLDNVRIYQMLRILYRYNERFDLRIENTVKKYFIKCTLYGCIFTEK